MWIEHINEQHDLAAFHSSSKQLDEWLLNNALDWEGLRLSRTYVLTDDGRTVLGFYALTGCTVQQKVLPRALRKGTPPRTAQPGCLLAQLAVRSDLEGRGLGRGLMVDAVAVALDANEQLPVRFMAVDPIDERARAIYEKWGFDAIPGDDAKRLYLSMDQARESFDYAVEP